MAWTPKDMLELARRHAKLEEDRDLDPLMETLVDEPHYEFHPVGLRMTGGDRVRRYYAQFFDDLLHEALEELCVVATHGVAARTSHRDVGQGH